MKINLRTKFLSQPRYQRYLSATGRCTSRAKRLYKANIRLAQAFHPLLTQFEVVLRNSLNHVLADYFADDDWIINQKTGFMADISLRQPHYYLKSCVQKTEAKLERRGMSLSSGRIISDQAFGFWVSFFLSHHYALVAGQPIHIFPYKPARENRASIYGKLDKIKQFRNRVSHCEPICFQGQVISCEEAVYIRATIYQLIEWMDPNLVPFFREIDIVPAKTARMMRI
jgi:hypothetical protein